MTEINQFLGVLILMGIVYIPEFRMYLADGSRFPEIADIISRQRLFEILYNMHFNDNTHAILDRMDPNYDRLYKTRPLLKLIRKTCLSIEPEEQNCIDEQIIPFEGRNKLKQYLSNKPHKWDTIAFASCGISGITNDFCFYERQDPDLPSLSLPKVITYQAAKFVL